LRLSGSTGYNQTKPIASSFVANAAPFDTADIHFDNVPTNATYSLTYIDGDGTETTIVDNAHYKDLNDNALPPEPTDTPAPTPEP
jgi:hypothetical protein